MVIKNHTLSKSLFLPGPLPFKTAKKLTPKCKRSAGAKEERSTLQRYYLTARQVAKDITYFVCVYRRYRYVTWYRYVQYVRIQACKY